MIHFRVTEMIAGPPVASGARTGENHARLMREQIKRVEFGDEGLLVFLDFTGIEVATASYIVKTVLWLTMCGRMHAGALKKAEQRSLDATVEPLNVFPVVLGANDDIQQEIDEVFARRGLACLIAEGIQNGGIAVGAVRGTVEPMIARTIRALGGVLEVTAEDLHAKCPGENVNVTAWNNRLSELIRIRLARRRRQGKFWMYQPLAEVMTYG
jgi:hypothetical protein